MTLNLTQTRKWIINWNILFENNFSHIFEINNSNDKLSIKDSHHGASILFYIWEVSHTHALTNRLKRFIIVPIILINPFKLTIFQTLFFSIFILMVLCPFFPILLSFSRLKKKYLFRSISLSSFSFDNNAKNSKDVLCLL